MGSWRASANYVKLQVAARGFSGKPFVVKQSWKKRQVEFIKSLCSSLAMVFPSSMFTDGALLISGLEYLGAQLLKKSKQRNH